MCEHEFPTQAEGNAFALFYSWANFHESAADCMTSRAYHSRRCTLAADGLRTIYWQDLAGNKLMVESSSTVDNWHLAF